MIPYIKKGPEGVRLMVDDKPFIVLGGETHNSSASSLDYMEETVWPNIRPLHLNTLISPVYWELLEPSEGLFDFNLVDGLIKQARQEGVKLVLLWFGLWKNGISTYVPSWVKLDSKRFFRARYADGKAAICISPLCEEAVIADSKAFSALMRHLGEFDGAENTVLLVQVENEIGLLGAERDYSRIANEAFGAAIPEDAAEYAKSSGTWEEAFKENPGEAFMAYHYAKAVEHIARAGKKEYPLPLYVNAWLEQHPDRPGAYPSGGPIAKMMPLWSRFAPSIDLFAPDIYLPEFQDICNAYTQNGNPLFIPEARQDAQTVSNLFCAIGKYHALGFSPFAIEDLANGNPAQMEERLRLAAQLNIDTSAFTPINTAEYLGEAYALLASMIPLLGSVEESGVQGFRSFGERGTTLSLGAFDLQIEYHMAKPFLPPSAGLMVQVGKEEFYLAGMDFSAELLPKCGSHEQYDFLLLEEGHFENGVWVPGRRLNGDEYHLSFGQRPMVMRVKVYPFE